MNCDATKPVLSSTLNICTLSSLLQVGWLKVTLMNQMSKSDFNGSTDSKSVSTKLIPSQRKTGELYTLTEQFSVNTEQCSVFSEQCTSSQLVISVTKNLSLLSLLFTTLKVALIRKFLTNPCTKFYFFLRRQLK